MKSSKIVTIVSNYKKLLEKEGFTQRRISITTHWTELPDEEKKSHVLYLIDVIINLSNDPSEQETLNRLLGCIQGIFLVLGIFTTEEVMRHNKKPEESFNPDPHTK